MAIARDIWTGDYMDTMICAVYDCMDQGAINMAYNVNDFVSPEEYLEFLADQVDALMANGELFPTISKEEALDCILRDPENVYDALEDYKVDHPNGFGDMLLNAVTGEWVMLDKIVRKFWIFSGVLGNLYSLCSADDPLVDGIPFHEDFADGDI